MIAVCLDGSKLAEQILPYATEQALRFESEVVLLQVISLHSVLTTPGLPGNTPGVPVYTQATMEQLQREEDEARAYLEKIAGPMRGRGLEVECITLQGIPGELIVSYAQENGVDLLAIATHGRSGLGRLVFGSVADFVVRHSGLPILLIRPKETEA